MISLATLWYKNFLNMEEQIFRIRSLTLFNHQVYKDGNNQNMVKRVIMIILLFIRKSCDHFYWRKRYLFLTHATIKYVSITITIAISQSQTITKPILLPNAAIIIIIIIIIAKVDEITILIYFTSRIYETVYHFLVVEW